MEAYTNSVNETAHHTSSLPPHPPPLFFFFNCLNSKWDEICLVAALPAQVASSQRQPGMLYLLQNPISL